MFSEHKVQGTLRPSTHSMNGIDHPQRISATNLTDILDVFMDIWQVHVPTQTEKGSSSRHN
jgi:hypothetical protein